MDAVFHGACNGACCTSPSGRTADTLNALLTLFEALWSDIRGLRGHSSISTNREACPARHNHIYLFFFHSSYSPASVILCG